MMTAKEYASLVEREDFVPAQNRDLGIDKVYSLERRAWPLRQKPRRGVRACNDRTYRGYGLCRSHAERL